MHPSTIFNFSPEALSVKKFNQACLRLTSESGRSPKPSTHLVRGRTVDKTLDFGILAGLPGVWLRILQGPLFSFRRGLEA